MGCKDPKQISRTNKHCFLKIVLSGCILRHTLSHRFSNQSCREKRRGLSAALQRVHKSARHQNEFSVGILGALHRTSSFNLEADCEGGDYDLSDAGCCPIPRLLNLPVPTRQPTRAQPSKSMATDPAQNTKLFPKSIYIFSCGLTPERDVCT